MYDIDGEFGQVRSICFPPAAQLSPDPDVPFHFKNAGWHRCNELYHIQRENGKNGHLLLFSLSDGGMLELADRPPVRLPAASVAWIPPRCSHHYYTGPGEIWEFYWLDIAEDPGLRFDRLFDEQSLQHITNMDEISREIEGILRSRNKNRQAIQIESSRMIGSIYHALLQERLSHKNAGKQDELVHSIIRSMEADCGQEWSLAKLSKDFFISAPQLIRRFKAETGMTPHAYLMTLRLQTGQMYLKYTGQSVEEISQKIGFPNASNFIQQFRRSYGMTPARYRGTNRR